MKRYRKQLVRPLLLVLLLVLGPLSAQSTYVCPMLGEVVLDKCCCDDHDTAQFTLDSERNTCCEKSVDLQIDSGSDQFRTTIKKADVRSDLDPPAAILVAPDFDSQPDGVIAVSNRQKGDLHRFCGSQTYLTSQRLRL